MKTIIATTIIAAFTLATIHAQEVGKPAPSFTATTSTEETVSLADFKGKIVVLEWTNLSCPFAKKHYSGKNMQNLQASYTGKGVIWLTVCSSAPGKQGYCDPAKMTECIKTEGINSSHVILDPSGELGKSYGARVTPHMFIVSKEGTLVYNGAIDSVVSMNSADIAKAVPLFKNGLDAVLAGTEVPNASNKPYGCGVKY
jgi:hypothetical protein